MILSCPSCATRYTIDESQLGRTGRTVRCTACKTTWHAEKPEEPIDLSFSDMRKPERVEDLQAVKAQTLPHTYRALIEDKKRAKALTAQGIVWAGLGSVAVLILALGFFLRVNIVSAFPSVAGAYAMVGAKVNPTHLDFVDSATTIDRGVKGGRFIVTIKAQIRNTSDKPVPVPPVRVKLLDGSLQEFNSVLMPAGGLIVAPGATRTLVFDVRDPLNMTNHVDLKFDLIAMKKMKSQPVPHVAQAAPAPPANASEGDLAPTAAVPEPQFPDISTADSDNGVDVDESVTQDGGAQSQPVSNRALPALRPALPANPLPRSAPNSSHDIATTDTPNLRGAAS